MNPPVILIIDDDRTIHEIVNATLSTAGIDCMFAVSAEEGLAIARQYQPQLILMDLLLPGGMKGWEAIAILRSESATANIPVLAFTAGSGQYIQYAMQAGADGYITKPFSLGQFQKTVKQHLDAVHR